MQEIPVTLPSQPDFRVIEGLIDRFGSEQGLNCNLKATLKKYPGCVHWHFKQKGHSGILEITLWAQTRRLWISLREGRRAAWVDEMVPALQLSLEQALKES